MSDFIIMAISSCCIFIFNGQMPACRQTGKIHVKHSWFV